MIKEEDKGKKVEYEQRKERRGEAYQRKVGKRKGTKGRNRIDKRRKIGRKGSKGKRVNKQVKKVSRSRNMIMKEE